MESLRILFNNLLLYVVLLTLFFVSGIALGFFFSLISFYLGVGWTIVLIIILTFIVGIFLSKKFDYTKL